MAQGAERPGRTPGRPEVGDAVPASGEYRFSIRRPARAALVIAGAILCGIAGTRALAAPEILPAGPALPAGTYEIDSSASSIGFSLRATLHTVEGTGGRVEGTFRVEDASEDSARVLGGELRIAAGSLETGNQRRDRKMRRETLSVEDHPEIRFAPGRAVADDGSFLLEGDLTIRGTTRRIAIPVTLSIDGGRLVVEGEIDLRYEDFGVPNPSTFVLRVAKSVKVRFHIEAVSAGSP